MSNIDLIINRKVHGFLVKTEATTGKKTVVFTDRDDPVELDADLNPVGVELTDSQKMRIEDYRGHCLGADCTVNGTTVTLPGTAEAWTFDEDWNPLYAEWPRSPSRAEAHALYRTMQQSAVRDGKPKKVFNPLEMMHHA